MLKQRPDVPSEATRTAGCPGDAIEECLPAAEDGFRQRSDRLPDIPYRLLDLVEWDP